MRDARLLRLPRLIIVLGWSFLLFGCTYPKPVLVQDKAGPLGAAASFQSILLLEPQLIYDTNRRVQGTYVSDLEMSKQMEIVKVISEYLQKVFTDRGFSVVTETELAPNLQEEVQKVKLAISKSGVLFKPRRRRSVLESQFGFVEKEDALAYACVKMKCRRTYAGGGQADKCTSNLVVLVIDLKKDELFWIREVFFRSRPLKEWWNSGGLLWSDGQAVQRLRESLEMLTYDFPESKEKKP